MIPFTMRALVLAAVVCGACAAEAVPAPDAGMTAEEVASRLAVAPRSLLPGADGFRVYRVGLMVGPTITWQNIIGYHLQAARKLIPANPDQAVLSAPSQSVIIGGAKPISADDLMKQEPRALLPDQSQWAVYQLKGTTEVIAAKVPQRAGVYTMTGYYDAASGYLCPSDVGRSAVKIAPGDIIGQVPFQAPGQRKAPTVAEIQQAVDLQASLTKRLIEAYAVGTKAHQDLVQAAKTWREAYAAWDQQQASLRAASLANAFDETDGGRKVVTMSDGRTGDVTLNKRNYDVRKSLASERTELDVLAKRLGEAKAAVSAAQGKKLKITRPVPGMIGALQAAQATIATSQPERVTPIPLPPPEVMPPRTYQLNNSGMVSLVAEAYPGAKPAPFSQESASRAQEVRTLDTMSVEGPPPGYTAAALPTVQAPTPAPAPQQPGQVVPLPGGGVVITQPQQPRE